MMTAFSRETTGAEVVKSLGEYIAGKNVVITGASAGGLGAQTALDIARAKPASLILLAREASKVQPVMDQIAVVSPLTRVAFVPVFLDDLDSVRTAAAQVLSHGKKIDVLINNAGIMAVPYALTSGGVESQFATNHLGHFVLTRRLLLTSDQVGRVVNVTSSGYRICPFRPDDVNFDHGRTYDPLSGYGQSKTANILFTKALAARGVPSFAVHPGLIPHTHLADRVVDVGAIFGTIDATKKRNTGREFGPMDSPKTMEQGSATTIAAAFDPSLVVVGGGGGGDPNDSTAGGAYLRDCQVAEVEEHARDPEMVEKLWTVSEELAGEKFDI